MRLLVASTNQHKVKEIRHIFSERPGLEIATLREFSEIPTIIEDGLTFQENAVKKAVGYAKATGLCTVADDSGLCVDALKGAPGVHSARFAGEAQDAYTNCMKLLKELQGIPISRRTARFECHIAFATPTKLVAITSGIVEGLIIEEMRGRNGFGYDPVFLYPKLNQTFAEIPGNLKNSISHRSRALAELKQILMTSQALKGF